METNPSGEGGSTAAGGVRRRDNRVVAWADCEEDAEGESEDDTEMEEASGRGARS